MYKKRLCRDEKVLFPCINNYEDSAKITTVAFCKYQRKLYTVHVLTGHPVEQHTDEKVYKFYEIIPILKIKPYAVNLRIEGFSPLIDQRGEYYYYSLIVS